MGGRLQSEGGLGDGEPGSFEDSNQLQLWNSTLPDIYSNRSQALLRDYRATDKCGKQTVQLGDIQRVRFLVDALKPKAIKKIAFFIG